MPLPSTAPAHFLGLELSTEQLRATIIDDELNVVGVESVDFDTELPEYQCVTCKLSCVYIHSILTSRTLPTAELAAASSRRPVTRIRLQSRCG
jgi:hypothetical protein